MTWALFFHKRNLIFQQAKEAILKKTELSLRIHPADCFQFDSVNKKPSKVCFKDYGLLDCRC
jgi:hypothetical protein